MAVGFKVADAYIEIHTEDDTRKGRQKVERDSGNWARRLGDKLGGLVGAGLARGIGKALFKALFQTAKLAAFGIVAGVVASAVVGLGSAIANLIPIIAELVNSLVAASGALLLIPGAIAGIIAIVATAKFGLKGFGEALKAVGEGDAAKLNEALKKLAPNARAFVREIAKLKPAWDRIRMRVQNALFAGLAKTMHQLGHVLLPELNHELVTMGRTLNGVVREAFQFLLDKATRLDLARIFRATTTTLINLRHALTPILQILRDVATVGAEVIADLSGNFATMVDSWAKRLSEFRAQGGLEQLIRDSFTALKELGGLLMDIVGIVRGLVRAAGGSGGLFGFFDRLNKLINSLEGQKALRSLFQDLDRVGRALVPVLLAIVKALVPVISGVAKIAEAFSPSLTVLALALGNALALLAEPIAALAPLIFALARGLGPVASILGKLVQAATPGLTAFIEALVDGLIALVPVAPVVGKALGDLFQALAPLLQALGPTLAVLLTEVATALSAVAKFLTPLIKLFSSGLVAVMERLLPPMLLLAEQILPMFAKAGEDIAKAFAPLMPLLIELVDQWLAAVVANLPVVLPLFAQLLGIFVQWAQIIGGALLKAFIAITPQLPALIQSTIDLTNALLELFVAIAPILPPLAKFVAEVIRLLIQTGLLQLGITILIGAIRWLTAAIQLVAAGIRIFIGWLTGAKVATQQLGAAVSNAIGAAIGRFRSLGATIKNAVGNLGSLLYRAGQNVIAGLWDGIRSMGGWLAGRIGQFVHDNIPGPVRAILGIASPSKLFASFGRDTIRGFWKGVSDQARETRRNITSFLPGVPPAPGFAGVPGPGGSPPRSGGEGGRPPTFGPYMIHIGDKVFAELVIDAVTGAPVQVAATADEGRRRRDFTSSARAGRR